MRSSIFVHSPAFRCSPSRRPLPANWTPPILRGSRAYEATPSYQIGPAAPSYEYAPPPSAAVMAPVPVAAPGYSFEFGARYWYSSGKLAKDLTTIRASPTTSSRA